MPLPVLEFLVGKSFPHYWENYVSKLFMNPFFSFKTVVFRGETVEKHVENVEKFSLRRGENLKNYLKVTACEWRI